MTTITVNSLGNVIPTIFSYLPDRTDWSNLSLANKTFKKHYDETKTFTSTTEKENGCVPPPWPKQVVRGFGSAFTMSRCSMFLIRFDQLEADRDDSFTGIFHVLHRAYGPAGSYTTDVRTLRSFFTSNINDSDDIFLYVDGANQFDADASGSTKIYRINHVRDRQRLHLGFTMTTERDWISMDEIVFADGTEIPSPRDYSFKLIKKQRDEDGDKVEEGEGLTYHVVKFPLQSCEEIVNTIHVPDRFSLQWVTVARDGKLIFYMANGYYHAQLGKASVDLRFLGNIEQAHCSDRAGVVAIQEGTEEPNCISFYGIDDVIIHFPRQSWPKPISRYFYLPTVLFEVQFPGTQQFPQTSWENWIDGFSNCGKFVYVTILSGPILIIRIADGKPIGLLNSEWIPSFDCYDTFGFNYGFHERTIGLLPMNFSLLEKEREQLSNSMRTCRHDDFESVFHQHFGKTIAELEMKMTTVDGQAEIIDFLCSAVLTENKREFLKKLEAKSRLSDVDSKF
jgi:hypothetical protein